MGPKGGISKKLKFQGKCCNCDQAGIKSTDCRLSNRKKSTETNMVDGLTQDVSDLDLSSIVTEVNIIGSNPREQWIDTRPTKHACSDRDMFNMFETIQNGQKLFIGNSTSSALEGKGKVLLRMISKKHLTLKDILYVPEL